MINLSLSLYLTCLTNIIIEYWMIYYDHSSRCLSICPWLFPSFHVSTRSTAETCEIRVTVRSQILSCTATKPPRVEPVRPPGRSGNITVSEIFRLIIIFLSSCECQHDPCRNSLHTTTGGHAPCVHNNDGNTNHLGVTLVNLDSLL